MPARDPHSETMTDESQISEREREILRLVATGATNQQIAQQLNISINTVKVHLRNIFSKIGAASRTEATLYAVRSGLVSVERAGAAVVAEEPEEGQRGEELPQPDLRLPSTETDVAPPLPPEAGDRASFAQNLPPDESALAALRHQSPTSIAPVVQQPVTRGETVIVAPHPAQNRLVIGLALIALLAVGGLIATLLLRPTAPAVAPTTAADPALPAANERWRSLAAIPSPRAEFALAQATFDGSSYLYVIGGENSQEVTGETLRYDLAANSWARYTAKPTPVTEVRGALIGGKIYVPGGRQADGTVSAALEVYDPQADSWATLAPMPAPRSRYGLAAVEGKLYLFGGWSGADYTVEVWQYSPDTDSWLPMTPLPAARAGAVAVEISGQVYLIGGENNTGRLTRHDRYSPAEEGQGNPWSVRAPLLEARSDMAAAGAFDRLFVFGGPRGALSYDISRDVWEQVALPNELIRNGLRSQFSSNGKVYILGGTTAEGPSADVFEYQALFLVTLPVSRIDQ